MRRSKSLLELLFGLLMLVMLVVAILRREYLQAVAFVAFAALAVGFHGHKTWGFIGTILFVLIVLWSQFGLQLI